MVLLFPSYLSELFYVYKLSCTLLLQFFLKVKSGQIKLVLLSFLDITQVK